MENKDETKYKWYILAVILIALLLSLGVVYYLFFSNKLENKFGDIFSYYPAIFSFGSSEFPPLEF
jgi:uncharacterized membrane protein